MGKISKLITSIILVIIVINLASCTPSENGDNKAVDADNNAIDNNKITEEIFDKLYENQDTQKFTFNEHGPSDEKNIKFNPKTGDVLYIASNIYPPYKQEENNPNDYDFLGEGYGKIEHKYDEIERFLYLRNIYTQEMFLVDKIEPDNEQNYTYDFTKDNQIEINGEILKKDTKTQENLVYAECNSTKSSFIEKDSTKINVALEIDKEIASKVLSHIKENYNIDSEVLLTLTFNDVSYVIVNIPNYYISMDNKYVKIGYSYTWPELPYNESGSSVELWKYENNECKRLLYNQINLSIYNMIQDKGYLMILGYEGNPGYIIKFDKNYARLYESKFQGLSKSPDSKYTFIYNLDESFSIIENDKMIINYNFRGNDDINTFWYKTIDIMGPYWWDMEFNKLYVFRDPQINPTAYIYCADLKNKEVSFYGSIRYYPWLTKINKQLSYILLDDSIISSAFDPDRYCAELFTYKKFTNYLYNLRTNEKIYLANKAIYGSIETNNNLVKYTQTKKYISGEGEICLEPIELTIDLSPYINKNRINYLKEIKKSIINSYGKNIKEENIELCLIFSTNLGNYQIVKINIPDNNSYYELWKIDNNKYEKIIDKTDCIFLTNNQEYLCAVSKNGELKIYDKNFDCIMNENIYSKNLLKRYNLESLEIGDYYVMKFDKNIFITIKNGENLVDVVNIDIVNKKISSIDYELNCNYDNHFINPENGYLIYQDGPSIAKYNELYKRKEASQHDLKKSLTAINLMTMEQKIITKNELEIYIYH